jgi:hypothetical protein
MTVVVAPSGVPDPFVPDPAEYSWLRIGVPGRSAEQGTQVDSTAVARIKIPADDLRARSGDAGIAYCGELEGGGACGADDWSAGG